VEPSFGKVQTYAARSYMCCSAACSYLTLASLTNEFAMSGSNQEGKRAVCQKCGFETNSPEIFALHKKNCPRV
jgi:hypothetical protein